MLKTFEIGKVYGDWMAVQIAASEGKLIAIKGPNLGNRYGDTPNKCFLSRDNFKYFFVSSQYPTNAGVVAQNATPDEMRIALGLKYKTKPDEVVSGKPDIVRFFRYIRPWDYVNSCAVSTAGATLAFEINYITRTVLCGVAVTKNENFCKQVGRDRSLARLTPAEGFNFTLSDSQFSNGGIVTNFINLLRVNQHAQKHPITKPLLDIVDGKFDRCYQ